MSLTETQVSDQLTTAVAAGATAAASAALTAIPARDNKVLPVVQVKPVPKGTAQYESRKADLLEILAAKVPPSYRLSSELISNPPTDVTGIPSSCGILSSDELAITENYDASGLAEAIANRKLTAVAVAMAFAKRAIIAHQLTCCLTQWFMDEAVEQARELDRYQAEHGRTVGPLHGVPVSIKEHIAIAGTSASYGFLHSTIESREDCHMVAALRQQGAVLYCKTNQPQALMHLESTSHYGRVLNPFNIHLTAGGSTGGEAALIAMKGSVLGVGTDIGGSIRAPAAFCGIYGYKTSSDMLPMQGYLLEVVPPELNIPVCTGPMARSLRDLDLFMHAVRETKPWKLDVALAPLPWTGLQTPLGDGGRPPRPLKIGIIHHDGFVKPQPPVQRALAWAREQLSDPRHAALVEVKDFHPLGAADAWSNARLVYYPDAGAGMRDGILAGGEPISPLSDWIWKDAEALGPVSAGTLVGYRNQRDIFRRAFAADWRRQDVDFVIGPAFVGPAPAHDTAFYWNYSALYNYVDYPGITFPTPLVAHKSEQYDDVAASEPLSEACRHVRSLWGSSDFEGAPVALQIIAPRYQDNELFGAMAVLKDILQLP
ncbi:amidase [Microdochium nivale]|nr:amidase [Microdochium nivale]